MRTTRQLPAAIDPTVLMEKLAVDRPRSHFTLRLMMAVIALCALLLALARLSPMWLWTFTVFGLPPVGYAMDRARGGTGIRGARLAGAIGFPAFLLLLLLMNHRLSWMNSRVALALTFVVASLSIVGLVWGGMLGRWIRLVEEIRDATRAPAVVARSSGWTSLAGRGSSPAAGSVPGRTVSTGPIADDDGPKEISWHEGGAS